LRDLAQLHKGQKEYQEAVTLYSEVWEIHRTSTEKHLEARAVISTDLDEFRSVYSKAVELHPESRKIQEEERIAGALSEIAQRHRLQEEYDKAIPLYALASEIWTALGDQKSRDDALRDLADVRRHRDEHDKAIPHCSGRLKIPTGPCFIVEIVEFEIIGSNMRRPTPLNRRKRVPELWALERECLALEQKRLALERECLALERELSVLKQQLHNTLKNLPIQIGQPNSIMSPSDSVRANSNFNFDFPGVRRFITRANTTGDSNRHTWQHILSTYYGYDEADLFSCGLGEYAEVDMVGNPSKTPSDCQCVIAGDGRRIYREVGIPRSANQNLVN
ncbi:hypothetical protein FRC01_013251, partial [Tulasnella sp. 417]